MPAKMARVFSAALLFGLVLPTLGEEASQSVAKQDVLRSDLQASRRNVLSADDRSSFLGQAYEEAIRAAVMEKQRQGFGRKLLQASDPIATCGLSGLVTQAAAAGVSLQALTNLFLSILFQTNLAASPSGFGFGGSGGFTGSTSVACNLVQLRLQALILAQASQGFNAQAGGGIQAVG